MQNSNVELEDVSIPVWPAMVRCDEMCPPEDPKFRGIPKPSATKTEKIESK